MKNESDLNSPEENQSQLIQDTGFLNMSPDDFMPKEKLLEFGVMQEGENIEDMFKRVITALKPFDDFDKEILEMMEERKIVPSTVMLMNAGIKNETPMSACTVPKIDLAGDFLKIRDTVKYFHLSGMGTGFNFDELEDPIPMVESLNKIGISDLESGKHLRPVGNMGVISITHPKMIDFINAKNESLNKKWVFNFSVLVDNKNLEKIKKGENITTNSGQKISSDGLLDEIAKSIYHSGEPGLVFIDRLNEDNQVPSTGEYKTLAPCGEVGLVEGETCQFSYINLGKFVNSGQVDYFNLEKAVKSTVRFLDDAVEYNISKYADDFNKDIAEKRRKIGLGVCGFADLLAKMGMNYDSPEARKVAEDIFSFINFSSKEESVQLAKERGSFKSFNESKYTTNESIILKYSKNKTEKVSSKMWLELDKKIKKYGIRNCATISIPPTSRSSLIIGASPSIEPYFSDIFDISPEGQISMIESIQKFTDESISKTVNIPETLSSDDIKKIIMRAIDSNLKGITIYRDKSRIAQPKKKIH